jgi:hypothetical protein
MTSPPTTTSSSASSSDSIKQFLLLKSIRLLADLNLTKLDQAPTLGNSFPCSISVHRASKHLEVSLVVHDVQRVTGQEYFSFYFLGMIKSLEKCFQKVGEREG